MIWKIMSLPFWGSGIFFMLCTFKIVPLRRPLETNGDLVVQTVIVLTLMMVCFYIAGRLVS